MPSTQDAYIFKLHLCLKHLGGTDYQYRGTVISMNPDKAVHGGRNDQHNP